MTQSDPDVLARVVAFLGLAVATISLGFNIWKEYWRGKRIRVGMQEASTGATSCLVVNAHNAGNTPVAVIDWGFRLTGAVRARIVPPNTGVDGPDLPAVLAGSQPLAPLSIAKSDLISQVRRELSVSEGEIKVHAYVIRDGGRRVSSKRRDALRLQL